MKSREKDKNKNGIKVKQTHVKWNIPYDCIHRGSLLKTLRHLGLHPTLINLKTLTISNTKSKVKFRNKISEPFGVKTGLR